MSRPVQPSSLGLRSIELLDGLPAGRLETLARECAWRRFQAGQWIISRDAADRDVYLLVAGRIRVTTYSAGGRQVTFRDFGPGEFFGDEPLVAERVLRRLASLVRRLSGRVIDLSTLNVQARIHAELLRLAREAGVGRNGARIDPAPRHATLASQISTYREQVTRELSALARKGILGKDGRALVVRDVERLEQMLERVKSGA